MTPTLCRVKDDPEQGLYGDCVRACVAAILDMDSETVPHFFHDNCDGMVANRRIMDFLRPLGLAPFLINLPGSLSTADIFEMMTIMNPETVFMLFGRTETGDHVVVCKGGKVVNDPSWIGTPLVGAGAHDYWTIMVIAKS